MGFSYHSLVLLNNGTVKAFGYNYYGQIGSTTSNKTWTPNPSPSLISGLSNVKQISTGMYYSLVLLNKHIN